MAEKRVSVRLAAVGGRQVRAELEGIGEAGTRGLGRLSREMEAANTRLAAFARRAGIAMAAAASAATAGLGIIVRNAAQSADQIRQFAQVANATPESFQRWAAGARTVGVEQEKLADILKDVNDRVGDFLQTGGGPMKDFFEQIAPRVGVTAEEFARLSGPEALQLYVTSLEKAGLSQQEMTFYLEAMASDATRLLPLLRDGGAEMTRFGDQARSVGAILDGEALSSLRQTQIALGSLGMVFDGIRNQIAVAVAPAVTWLAEAFVALAYEGGALRTALDALGENLGRMASYAAAFVGIIAARWVAGLAAAALSVRGLATALVVLRGALIRTGIGALIVGAGELIFQFGRLVQGTGSVGAALGLLGDVAREVWDRMKLGMVALGLSIMAGWAEISAGITAALQTGLEAVVGFGNATLNTFQGAMEAVKVLWSALPATIGEFAYGAANALIGGVEAMLNGVAARIDGFLEGINAGLDVLGIEKRVPLIGTIELGGIENPFEGAAANAGAEARAAFEAAFSSDPIAPPDLGLTAAAEAARGEAARLRDMMGEVATAATAPLQSVAALRDAVSASGSEAAAGLEDASTAASGLGTALQGAGEAAEAAGSSGRGAGNALREGADAAKNAWEATADAVRKAQEKSREIAQGLAQDITGPIKEALTSGEFTWESFAGAISRIAQNLATRLIDLAFKPIENALINAFTGGGAGGGGGFFASLFGFAKGGVFAGGAELTAFAQGGVVNRPTVFPFAKGVGLMGEAGPEAILPLRRGKGGRLGVEMNGDGAAAASSMSTRIINVLDPSVVGDYLATPSGERAILNVIRRNRGAINA
ncbi:phage tail tape measure protein [Rhodobacteraceae bacterium HSP-20]|uniref:Phage tail tape measure protein n=1 Tax=Paragemmobacter amnigenus TaxID=2852097 RepID=A0ABS6J8T3_9RHOB|nr:phage tail tape measure protein [Rhodobacter amnigenus]MBU9699992.1 phage tail tape measure protein [Rhodobacter amnigenus]MBV4391219.1 phage tail tape measure protein [Rhodobacter amnigenus]